MDTLLKAGFLKLRGGEDGLFFMTYEDFIENFGVIQVCHVHDDFNYTSFKIIEESREG